MNEACETGSRYFTLWNIYCGDKWLPSQSSAGCSFWLISRRMLIMPSVLPSTFSHSLICPNINSFFFFVLIFTLFLSFSSLLSPWPLPSDCLSHLCWPSAFLLLGCLLLDVSGGCATLSHAGGGLWERVLPQKVLLSVWLLLPRTGGGHLSGHRLQELWDQESVRVKTGLFAPADWEVGLCYSPSWKCNMQCCVNRSCTSPWTGFSEHT